MSVKSWFLLQFKPNSHRVALRNLHRQGFETFLPMQDVTQRKPTKLIQQLKPLFPGYMFVAFERESAPWHQIKSTIGVSRLVSFDGQPKALPLDLVSSLMRRCDSNGELLLLKQLNTGENVELISGPFTTFVATVEHIDENQRVFILMDFMGRQTRLHVSHDQLQVL